MDEFLSFRKMITPLLIQAIFWLGVIFTVLSALFLMFRGAVLMGLIYIVVGPLLVRIYCELLILFFRILDELTAIRTALTGSSPGGFPVSPTAAPAATTATVHPGTPPGAAPTY